MTPGDEATPEDREELNELWEVLAIAAIGCIGLGLLFCEAAALISRICIRGTELAFRDTKR